MSNNNINKDNMIDFHFKNDLDFARFLKDKDYITTSDVLDDNRIIAYIDQKYYNRFLKDLGQGKMNVYPALLGLLGRSELEASGISQIQNQTYLNLNGQGVLLAFIDTGIDYTKKEFIYEDGTSKIKYLWDQTVTDSSDENVQFGAQYDENKINEALASDNPMSIVPQIDEVGHGTFLASQAAGRSIGTFIGAAPESDLIIVKLRKARTFWRDKYLVTNENAYESTDLMLGIDYVLKKAAELNRPVSICIGVGTNIGGHDGLTDIEQYITAVSQKVGVCICTSAGNESQAKRHTSGTIDENELIENVEIIVPENSNSFSLIIWNEHTDRISVGLISPTGEKISRIPARVGVTSEFNLVLEEARVTVQYFFPYEQSGSQITFIRIINPTPGIWNIVLHGDIILSGQYHIWLPIEELNDNCGYFANPVPNTTVVIPGTAHGSITCGAYNSSNNSIYAESSWGPSRTGLVVPEFVAPGVNVAGIFPGGPGVLSGTSVAASITAGACALMLQWGIVNQNDKNLNTYRIRAYLIRGCDRDENITYPNNQWGYGKLNLYNTFVLLRDI